MTRDVVTVPPDLPVMAIARLLRERRISAVPVVAGDGALLGIVTEADLIRRLAAMLDKPPSWFASLLSDPATEADPYARARLRGAGGDDHRRRRRSGGRPGR